MLREVPLPLQGSQPGLGCSGERTCMLKHAHMHSETISQPFHQEADMDTVHAMYSTHIHAIISLIWLTIPVVYLYCL